MEAFGEQHWGFLFHKTWRICCQQVKWSNQQWILNHPGSTGHSIFKGGWNGMEFRDRMGIESPDNIWPFVVLMFFFLIAFFANMIQYNPTKIVMRYTVFLSFWGWWDMESKKNCRLEGPSVVKLAANHLPPGQHPGDPQGLSLPHGRCPKQPLQIGY